MSYDQAIKWAFIGFVVFLDGVLLHYCNLQLQWHDLIMPAGCAALLAVLSVRYHMRGGEPLVLCMVSLLQLGAFTTVIAVFIYAVTAVAMPLNDHWLRAMDAALGYSPPRLVQWMRAHPAIDRWSTWAYLIIVPQTLVMVLAIAFSAKRQRLERFVWQFMLATFICGLFALVLPAYGPLHGQGIVPARWQQPYLDHVFALRSGERFIFSWKETEGLVTFPSFHTSWAIFLIVVWREQSAWLFVPMSILNVAIVISTLTTGEHYLLDVFGGTLLAAGCVYASHRMNAFAYAADGTPRVVSWIPTTLPGGSRQWVR